MDAVLFQPAPRLTVDLELVEATQLRQAAAAAMEMFPEDTSLYDVLRELCSCIDSQLEQADGMRMRAGIWVMEP